MPFRVAIVGAGPAGCVLAVILLKAGIACTIYEAEASATSRGQGGSLDLHPKTGQAALKRAGLWDAFMKYARYEGEAFKLCDPQMNFLVNLDGTSSKSSRGRPEIDRGHLRQLLVEALPADTIKWGKQLKSVTNDPVCLHFADDSQVSDFDLLVGADGAFSRVRPILTPVKPDYLGLVTLRYRIEAASKAHPGLHALVNHGSLFAFAPGAAVVAQANSNDVIDVICNRTASETYLDEHPCHRTSPAESKALSIEEKKGWHTVLLAFLQAASEEHPPWSRNMYTMPDGHSWAHVPGVTLIGDAAHLMPPFAGVGANLALQDGMLLAEAIISAAGRAEKLESAIACFEKDMFARAQEARDRTMTMMQAAVGGLIRDNLGTYIGTAAGEDLPRFLRGTVVLLARLFFAVQRKIKPEGPWIGKQPVIPDLTT